MPSEPEKPIEKLLRRWSNERRKQAGDNWEMHPVNRRILHQEIAQQLGRKAFGRAGSRFSRLLATQWFKPASAIVVVACLVITGLLLFSSPPDKDGKSLAGNQTLAPAAPVQVAFNDKASKTELKKRDEVETKQGLADNAPVSQQLEKAAQGTLASKDNGSGRESLLDEAAARDATKNAVGPNEQQSPLVAASGRAPAPRLENLQRYGLANGLGGAIGPAPAAEPTGTQVSATADRSSAEKEMTPAAPAFQPSISGAASPGNLIQYGRFVAAQNQTAPGQDNSVLARRSVSALSSSTPQQQDQPGSVVLNSFRIEQLGPVLRVIDTDDSVYTGTIQGTNLVMTAAALPAGAVLTVPESAKTTPQVQGGQSPNQNVAAFFRVSGTNRSLNQRVVFSGTLSELTNAYFAGAVMQNQGGSSSIGGALNLGLTNQQLQSLQVNGTAWVEGKHPLQINAVPAVK